MTSSRVRLGQSFKTVGYGCASCWGDVGAGNVEADVLPPRMRAQFLNSPPFLIASQEYCTYFLFPPFLVSSAVISFSFLRQSLLFSSPLCGRCQSQDEFSLPVLLQFTVVSLFPTLTLFEERVGIESVSCTGSTCVPSVQQTGGHFLFPRPTPYLVVSLSPGTR